MKKTNIFYVYLLFSSFCFFSCSNEDELLNGNQNNILVDAKQKAKDLAEMTDTTVYQIEGEGKFGEFSDKIFKQREQELIDKGFTKIEPIDLSTINSNTKASVQVYQEILNPMSTQKIEYSMFKAKFSQKFCDEINAVSYDKISSSKTYVCIWYNSWSFFNLASNQRPGPMESPEAALIPSKRSGYSERGYEAWVNAHNQFHFESHQLIILYEDVNHSTTYLEIRYPFWPNKKGYIMNYAILTL